MAKQKDILTTGEVAKICNVAPRTVSKWFDSGQL
ncbi:MAG: regulator, partial [Planctomycetota bacterium]